ncbi:hypothetical protein HIM_12264 [Hirsutella minnesotensis 3608]|uniref:Uncharacterized protein n=1 Tax=Hirsutella minnesotensis 3608 TaxID=1043627 RepID=A0A0F7ZW47_9HYPO|nr:hypothetical protein HIM_12264 [Hirsutella minnesotensis 3608]
MRPDDPEDITIATSSSQRKGKVGLGGVVRVNVCIPKSISGEEESLMRGIWQEEAGRFVKLASKGASAIFTEGHGYCSIEEFDSVKGRELLEKTIEIVLMETEEARSVA